MVCMVWCGVVCYSPTQQMECMLVLCRYRVTESVRILDSDSEAQNILRGRNWVERTPTVYIPLKNSFLSLTLHKFFK